MDGYHIVELIAASAGTFGCQEDLFKVEWAYLPLLDRHEELRPNP